MKLGCNSITQILLLAFCAGFNAQAAVIAYSDHSEFIAATDSLTVDDFERSPWSPADRSLPKPVVSLGNSWTANDNLMAVTSASFSGATSVSSIDSWSDSIDSINAELGDGATAVGGFVNLDFADGVSLTIFDVADNLIGSAITSALSGWQFIGLTSDIAIARLQFVSTSQPNFDDFVLDDFHFGAAAVFEPATIVLVVLGLAGMRHWRPRAKPIVG